MTTLAALELRLFIEKMSGARLPIVTEPTAGTQVRIHVGKSAETKRLGVTADGLRDGAYRIAMGADWVVLLGADRDFEPGKMPWPLKRSDAPRAEAEWKKLTAGKSDAAWGFPFASGFKAYWNPGDFLAQMTARYGEDFPKLWGGKNGFWNYDQSGSLNAVLGLLRQVGALNASPGETWVMDAEGMQGDAIKPFDIARTIQRGANNRVYLCRIVWSKPNRLMKP